MESQTRLPREALFPLILLFALLVPVFSLSGQRSQTIELFDGERVVFLGNTFVERAIDYGYIEFALTTHWPDRTITFRNLGWSGDDAQGRARRFFGTLEDGFNNLKSQVEGLDPTILFVCYGTMEAFEGEAGLPGFKLHINHLLDTLGESRARLVLVSPFPHENLGPPLPDPAEHNRNLKLYSQTLGDIAQERKLGFIDLFSFIGEAQKASSAPLTDNGIHLNDLGYRVAADGFLWSMGLVDSGKSVQLSARGKQLKHTGLRVEESAAEGKGLAGSLKSDRLEVGSTPPVVSIQELFAGDYLLRLNGKEVGTYSAGAFTRGVRLPFDPDEAQTRELLKVIREKNQYFFFKWRPENETYLRGFRKREQGQNAAELEEFDAYIEAEEAKIAELKVPRAHTFQVQRKTEK